MVHSITLQTYDGEITDNDILGQICFAAPNEEAFAAGAVTASIFARSETSFDDDDNNETELVFATASGGATGARPAADLTGDMILSSAGNLTIAGAIELGNASDTTLARASSGDLNVEGNLIYRAGGTDVPLTDGGTGSSTASGARTNLGLVIGTNVQAYDAQLASVAGWTAAQVTTIGNIGTVTTASDKMIYTTSADTFAETAITTFARTILDDADEATFKATVNLEIGTDVQAYDAQLDTLAALTANQVGGLVDLATLEAPASDGQFIVATGSGAFAYESGATARTSLGLVIGTNVQAYDAQLDTLAALTADQVGGLVDLATLEAPASDGQFIVATGSGAFAYESGATARTSLGLGSAAERAAEDTLTDGANLPDGAAIKAYGDANWAGGGSSDLDATTDSGTIDIDLDSETLTVAGGTGIDTSATGTTITVAVDVSDFMAAGVNNRVLTATGTDAFTGESNLTFGGGDLLVGGSTPSVTIGDAGSEDVKLVFDHSDADYYLGVDHVAGGGDDIFKIGIGSALGTTPVINITPAGAVSFGIDGTGYDLKLFGATAGRYWQWDEDQDGVRLRGNFVQEAIPVSNAGHTVVEGTDGNTIDIDWKAGNYHWVKLGASNISKIIFRNMKRGGRYILRIQQGATARTIAESAWTGMVSDDSDTAFTELRWVGGDPPTMSTGTSSTDVYGFLGTRSNGLGCDAFVVAQDLQDSIT